MVGRTFLGRYETIRLLGDARKITPALRTRLAAVARAESSPTVRSQLACSARRLPGSDCLPLVRRLMNHDEDIADIHVPLLLWWAIEAKA